jgi:hypothetical protein
MEGRKGLQHHWKSYELFHRSPGIVLRLFCDVLRQKLAETQHLAITQGLKRLFKDTQWTVDQLSFVVGHKSVSASVCHDLLSKFGISKD